MTRHNIRKEETEKEKQEEQENKIDIKKELKAANIPIRLVSVAAIAGAIIFIRKAPIRLVVVFGIFVGVIYSFKDHWLGRRIIGHGRKQLEKGYQKVKDFFTSKKQGDSEDKKKSFIEQAKEKASGAYESASKLFSDKQKTKEAPTPTVNQNI